MLAKLGQLLRDVVGGGDPAALPPPGEVIPTLEVGNAPPDLDYSKGLYRFCGTATKAAVVAAYSQVFLSNASGKGVVAIVHEVSAYSPGTNLDLEHATTAGYSGTGTEHALDGRIEWGAYTTRKSTCQVLTNSSATPAGDLMYKMLPASTQYFFFRHPVILWPGQTLYVTDPVLNQLLIANFVWSEREFNLAEIRGVNPSLIWT